MSRSNVPRSKEGRESVEPAIGGYFSHGKGKKDGISVLPPCPRPHHGGGKRGLRQKGAKLTSTSTGLGGEKESVKRKREGNFDNLLNTQRWVEKKKKKKRESTHRTSPTVTRRFQKRGLGEKKRRPSRAKKKEKCPRLAGDEEATGCYRQLQKGRKTKSSDHLSYHGNGQPDQDQRKKE